MSTRTHLVPSDVNLLDQHGLLQQFQGYSQDFREIRVVGDLTFKFDSEGHMTSASGCATSRLFTTSPKEKIQLNFEVQSLPETEKKRADEALSILPIGCFMSSAGYICVPLPLAEEIIQRLPTQTKIFVDGKHLDLTCEVREVVREIQDPSVRALAELLQNAMLACCSVWEAQTQLTHMEQLLERLAGTLDKDSVKLLLQKIECLKKGLTAIKP